MDRFVCSHCFTDPGLKAFVEGEAVSTECNFCGEVAGEPIAAPVEAVGEYINDQIKREYDDAANWLPYESAEGGWQGKTWNRWELLADELGIQLPRDSSGELFEALVDSVDECDWCTINPFGLDYEQRGRFSWERFCRVVQHERRFFFSQHSSEAHDDLLAPGETLRQIFEYAETMELFVPMPSATFLYRARRQRWRQRLISVDDLGPPPPDRANQSNRMSPPGIVMFYASDDPETALRETAAKAGTYAVGTFVTTRDAIILDLTRLPEIPSLFEQIPDSLEYEPRKLLTFLHHVAGDISRPIARDDRVHVSYVPTQIVTEYVRSQLIAGRRIDGIRYQSAVHADHASYVLFATQENMIDSSVHQFPPDDAWIGLNDVRVHRITRGRMRTWRRELDFSASRPPLSVRLRIAWRLVRVLGVRRAWQAIKDSKTD
jgi:hypothetical protein